MGLHVLLCSMVAAHLAYSCFDVGRANHAALFDCWVLSASLLAVCALCVLRAAAVRAHRSAWVAMAVCAGLFTLGGLHLALVGYWDPDPPYPGWNDAAFLGSYPAAYAGLMLLIRRELAHHHASVWLDGLIGMLALSALVVGVRIAPIAAAAEGSLAAVATNIAYPLADLLLLAGVVGVYALSGWRPGRGWVLLGLAFVILAVTDTIYLYRLAVGSYEYGTPLDYGWLVAFAVLGVAAWRRPESYRLGREGFEGPLVLLAPLGFIALALGILVAAEPLDVPPLATALAAAAIVASAVRLCLSFREVHALAAARREAVADDLTGLPNRRQLYRTLAAATADAAAHDRSLALLLIDLDHFKELNDTLGHYAGDLLLRQVGPGEGDIARLGGDEFAVVLGDCAAAEPVAARLRQTLREPFEILDVHLRIDASIGIAHFPAHGTTPEVLMQRADIAMYQAKTGRRGHQTYAVSADHLTRERLELMSALPDAIADGQLVLHYQPIVELQTGCVPTVEALVRWQHPTRGLLMPGAFLPFAEQSADAPADPRGARHGALADRGVGPGRPVAQGRRQRLGVQSARRRLRRPTRPRSSSPSSPRRGSRSRSTTTGRATRRWPTSSGCPSTSSRSTARSSRSSRRTTSTSRSSARPSSWLARSASASSPRASRTRRRWPRSPTWAPTPPRATTSRDRCQRTSSRRGSAVRGPHAQDAQRCGP
jgi:diguanylate cyclase